MKKILKKMNEFYAKGSDVGIFWLKTAFYYSFIPIVLYLGFLISFNKFNINSHLFGIGLKSVDFRALINSFKGESGPM